jgi:hypothetical protein
MAVPLNQAQEHELDTLLNWYLRGWGPVDWRDLEEDKSAFSDHRMGYMLLALSEIEADSKTMRKKVAATGGDQVRHLQEFIIVWLAEEGEHGRALARLAARYGVTALPAANWRKVTRDWRSTITWPSLYLSRSIPGMCAVYSTLGAMQELIALTTYNFLAKRLDEKSATVLRRIARQESRHMKFYRTAASVFLSNSTAAQRATRVLIDQLWRPPGMDLLGAGSFESIFEPLLTDPQYASALTAADRIASSLPGLGSVTVMQRYLNRNGFEIADGRGDRIELEGFQ